MNYCKKCGSSAPEGKELCWLCEHEPKLRRPKEAFERMTTDEFGKDSNVLTEEECEACRIPEQAPVSQNPKEKDNGTEECEMCRIPEQAPVSQNPEEKDNETEDCEMCRIPEPDPKEK